MSIHIIQQICREYVETTKRRTAPERQRPSDAFLFRKQFSYRLNKKWNHHTNRFDKNYEIKFNGEVISNELKTIKQVNQFINEKVRG
jgi:hypothetical protein